MKSEAVIIGQCRLFQVGDGLYAMFAPVPGGDVDGLDELAPLDEEPDGAASESQAGGR